MDWPFDIIGLLGSGCILVSYACSQMGRLDVRRPLYPTLNALGAALLLISLAVDFNLAATVIEGFWLVISVAGIGRSLRARRATPGAPAIDDATGSAAREENPS